MLLTAVNIYHQKEEAKGPQAKRGALNNPATGRVEEQIEFDRTPTEMQYK